MKHLPMWQGEDREMMELYFQIKAIGSIIILIIMVIFLIIGIVLMIWGSRKK